MNPLLEDRVDNVQVIQTAADIILAELPDVIYGGAVIEIVLFNSPHAVSRIKELIQQYKEDSKIKQFLYSLTHASTFFRNSERDLTHQNFAEYRPYKITFYLPAFLGAVLDLDTRKLLRYRTHDTTVRTILIHELRHMFQFSQYPDYYRKRVSIEDKNYKTEPLEIDAAWHHVVGSKNPKFYDTAYRFVTDVMSEFNLFKQLTDSQFEHYRRKTAKYFYLHRVKAEQGFLSDFVSHIYQSKSFSNYNEFLTAALEGFFGVEYDPAEFTPEEVKEYVTIKQLTRDVYRRTRLNKETYK